MLNYVAAGACTQSASPKRNQQHDSRANDCYDHRGPPDGPAGMSESQYESVKHHGHGGTFLRACEVRSGSTQPGGTAQINGVALKQLGGGVRRGCLRQERREPNSVYSSRIWEQKKIQPYYGLPSFRHSPSFRQSHSSRIVTNHHTSSRVPGFKLR